ncbi:hypothetical protein FCOIX_7369 [Fusarium coicis]|nr:hypothetical protein FCOIX_7369 [Fusarium coicis]
MMPSKPASINETADDKRDMLSKSGATASQKLDGFEIKTNRTLVDSGTGIFTGSAACEASTVFAGTSASIRLASSAASRFIALDVHTAKIQDTLILAGQDAEARGVDLGSAPVFGGLYVDVVQLNARVATLAVHDHFLAHGPHSNEIDLASPFSEQPLAVDQADDLVQLLGPPEVAFGPPKVEDQAHDPGHIYLVVPDRVVGHEHQLGCLLRMVSMTEPNDISGRPILTKSWLILRTLRSIASGMISPRVRCVMMNLFSILLKRRRRASIPCPTTALRSPSADHVLARPQIAKAPGWLGRDGPSGITIMSYSSLSGMMGRVCQQLDQAPGQHDGFGPLQLGRSPIRVRLRSLLLPPQRCVSSSEFGAGR